MADPIYQNALRAARELWYDEQNLGELNEDVVHGEQIHRMPPIGHEKPPRTWRLCPVRLACQWVVR
jgi:hypothetical protein